MFTIEHDFDASVITLIDEGPAPRKGDITITAFAEEVQVEQVDPRTETVSRVILSPAQLKELAHALNLPEGAYRLPQK